MKSLVFFICTIVLIATGQTLADSWFSDNFNNNVIDTTHWQYGGDGISERSGVLSLNRSGPEDYIQTAYTYSGNFIINLDIRLNYINWNDVLHGVTIAASMDNQNQRFTGISMGYSKWDQLYCAVPQSDGSIRFYYGASNLEGQWQHWTLTKNGNNLSILVNGDQVTVPQYDFIFGGTVPDTVRVYLPGFFDSYDGSSSITSSSVDNFSIIPEPSTLLLLGLCAAMVRRKK